MDRRKPPFELTYQGPPKIEAPVGSGFAVLSTYGTRNSRGSRFCLPIPQVPWQQEGSEHLGLGSGAFRRRKDADKKPRPRAEVCEKPRAPKTSPKASFQWCMFGCFSEGECARFFLFPPRFLFGGFKSNGAKRSRQIFWGADCRLGFQLGHLGVGVSRGWWVPWSQEASSDFRVIASFEPTRPGSALRKGEGVPPTATG